MVVGAMACWCQVVEVGDNIVDILVVDGMVVGGVLMSIMVELPLWAELIERTP